MERSKITINNAGEAFFYKGRILDDSSDFILLEDDKEGLIRLSKYAIISIKKLEEASINGC